MAALRWVPHKKLYAPFNLFNPCTSITTVSIHCLSNALDIGQTMNLSTLTCPASVRRLWTINWTLFYLWTDIHQMEHSFPVSYKRKRCL